MTQYVDIQGEPLAVQIYEPKNSKADVVLIHGFTGSKEDFADIGPLIATAGFRALTFDNRGQHESSHSRRADGYSMSSLGRDVIEISDYFQLRKPHLLGHSFGGLIAQQAVMRSPDHWSSLTLMCSGPAGRSDWLAEPQFKNLNNDTKVEIWERVLAPERIDNPRFALLKKRWLSSDANSTMIYRDHLRRQPSLITQISKLGMRSHVLYGENDDAWPLKEQDAMAHELGAKLTVLPNSGHCPNEDNPHLLVNELIRFWERS